MNMKLWEKNIPYLTTEVGLTNDSGLCLTPITMDTYFIDTDKPLPCIVVLPGGGYSHRAYHEGEPVARYFNSRGLHAVVVNYRVRPNLYPAPLADAQRAIKLLRANADAWKVNPDRIVTLGFSAGGHLSGACATFEDVLVNLHDADETDRTFSAKPNGAILCYAALSCEKDWGNYGCGNNLLGAERNKYESTYFTIQNRVTDDTPPMFIWQTSDDNCVNVMNAMRMGEVLRDHKIPFELHVYPHGRHGIGLAADFADASDWSRLAADWVERWGGIF